MLRIGNPGMNIYFIDIISLYLHGNNIYVGQSSSLDLNQTPDVYEDVDFVLYDMITKCFNKENEKYDCIESIQHCDKTSKIVPFGPPTFEKTPIDLNDAFKFSLDSHPSIIPPTFEKTPIDLDDALDFLF